jgi:hypothetical protein
LGAANRGSVWEEEVHEIFGEDVGGRSSERVCTVHRHLVVDTNRNDVPRGNGLVVDLVVGRQHAEDILNAQVKGAVHALGNMPAEGTEPTCHRAPGLHLAFLDLLACLEGGGLQLLQILLRGVVGRLDSLRLGRRVHKSGLQALKTKNTKQNWERIPNKPSQQAKSRERWLTFDLLLLCLEGHACSLSRLLQAKDRSFMLLDSLALIREGDA